MEENVENTEVAEAAENKSDIKSNYVHNTEFSPLTSEIETVGVNHYMMSFNRIVVYVALAALFGVLCAVLSVLTTNVTASSDKGIVYIFFVSIVIVAITIKKFALFGLITAGIGSALFCVALRMSFTDGLINVAVNLFQALLIYFAFLLIKKKFGDYDPPKDSKSSNNSFTVLQALIGITFTCVGLFVENVAWILRGIAIAELVIYILYIALERNKRKLVFFACLCVIPSLLSGIINGLCQTDITAAERISNIETWALSNYVLLASFGYVFIESFNRVNSTRKLVYGDINIKATTVLYFAAAFFWNIFFFVIYYIGWLGKMLVPYLLPWIVGNLLFLLNMYFDRRTEVGEEEKSKAFKWYEQRAIVAENNTQFLISIITFLLPISTSLFGKELDAGIVTLFCINITCACLAIGLIWIPSKEVKAMSLVKSLKTVFHLLTVSFLLLTATMIIVS